MDGIDLTATVTELDVAVAGDAQDKLDVMIVALGGAPPTAAITLADVVAALVEQKAVLDDIHLDTQSQDLKLLVIRDEILDIHLGFLSFN